jgi:putative toxin-antitoxin system antitoxin component (TIGR02293 family)
MYGTSIGLKPQNSAMIISKLKRGLPVRTFERLRKNLDVTEKALSKVLNIALTTLARRKNAGRLSFEESERLFRIARLYDKTVEVFEDPQMARKWLKEPSWALGDVTPLQYADTELGAQEVEDLLGRIEHGVFT